jgi:hypothetical protein
MTNNEKAKKVIQKYVDKNTSRQRDTFYDFVNNELNLILNAYNYSDGRSEKSRVELSDPNSDEYKYLIGKIEKALDEIV